MFFMTFFTREQFLYAIFFYRKTRIYIHTYISENTVLIFSRNFLKKAIFCAFEEINNCSSTICGFLYFCKFLLHFKHWQLLIPNLFYVFYKFDFGNSFFLLNKAFLQISLQSIWNFYSMFIDLKRKITRGCCYHFVKLKKLVTDLIRFYEAY